MRMMPEISRRSSTRRAPRRRHMPLDCLPLFIREPIHRLLPCHRCPAEPQGIKQLPNPQPYCLLRLTVNCRLCIVDLPAQVIEIIGERAGIRTLDLLIKSQLLYRLSYALPCDQIAPGLARNIRAPFRMVNTIKACLFNIFREKCRFLTIPHRQL